LLQINGKGGYSHEPTSRKPLQKRQTYINCINYLSERFFEAPTMWREAHGCIISAFGKGLLYIQQNPN
jgi:hypothetical protein